MNRFDQAWQQAQQPFQKACPLTDEEVSQAVRQAQQATPAPQPLPHKPAAARRRWIGVTAITAAAAMLAALLLPQPAAKPFRTVRIDGQQILFACNDGCSPSNVTTQLSNYIREQ